MQETMQEIWVWSLGQEDSLEEGMATQSSVLDWRIPQTERAGGLQSLGSQSRTRLKWLSTHTQQSYLCPQLTPGLLPRYCFMSFSSSPTPYPIRSCYRPNICVLHQNPHIEALSPSMIIFGIWRWDLWEVVGEMRWWWWGLCHGIGGGLVAKSCLTLVTPWTVARQAPLSMGCTRQESWSGLPFPIRRAPCKVAVCKPGKKSHQESNQLAPWSWTFQALEPWELNCFCLGHPVYDTLLWQLEQTKTTDDCLSSYFLTALLRYISHITQSNHLKSKMQCLCVFVELCDNHHD